jgi:Domain of unknown function (DUF4440)
MEVLMNRLVLVVTLLLSTGIIVRTQDARPPSRVLDVVWRDVFDAQGHRMRAPVVAPSPSNPVAANAATGARESFPDHSRIIAIGEEWRRTKLANDVQAMQHLLSDGFFETNQNGNSRDRTEILKLWSTFKIVSLAPERESIRVHGDIAIVTGEETEVNATGTDRLMFTRLYARTAANGWQLISSTQFRNPRGSAAAPTAER